MGWTESEQKQKLQGAAASFRYLEKSEQRETQRFRKMAMTTLYARQKKDTDVYNGLLDSEGEGEGGMIWENGNSNLYTIM